MKKSFIVLAVVLFCSISLGALAAQSSTPVPSVETNFSTFRDIIIPLANMGIGAIIAILLIWQIFPILNRNTETLKEIAATLDVISNNNLRLAEKLLDIIEKQSLSKR